MNLNELQAEIEKLLSLLKDRQQGCMSWNIFLEERLRNIVNMAASAGLYASNHTTSP